MNAPTPIQEESGYHIAGKTHVTCISDFCGCDYPVFSPGAWADIFENEDGTQEIVFGGNWWHYAPYTPATLKESHPFYSGFIKACETCEEFGFARSKFTPENGFKVLYL